MANTCAPSVREWYHTRSLGENILGLKKQHDTSYTFFLTRNNGSTKCPLCRHRAVQKFVDRPG